MFLVIRPVPPIRLLHFSDCDDVVGVHPLIAVSWSEDKQWRSAISYGFRGTACSTYVLRTYLLFSYLIHTLASRGRDVVDE